MTPAEALQESLPDAVEEIVDEGTHPFVRVKAESIVEAARVLREKCGADMLHQVSGVDFADHMEVVYHFTCIEKPVADFYCLKVNVPRDNPEVPSLANEWAAHRVHVNGIAPGYILTDATAEVQDNPERYRDTLKRIPAGRWGTPEDLQGVVVFLASGASDYLHGTVVTVDGGWMGR